MILPPTACTQKNGGRVPDGRKGTSDRQLDFQPPSRISFANCSTVGALNSVASGSLQPSAFSISENTRTAASECPPKSKKLSVTPIELRPRTSFQIQVS